MPATYYIKLTNAGLAALATAQATGTPVSISHFAVGDSNGAYYEPSESQTALVHEVWRDNVNRVYIHPNNGNWAVVEALIPYSDGGFDIREAGAFSSNGTLLAVGKYPLTNKPAPDSGSEKNLYVRMIMQISNAATIQQTIDDSLVMATTEYVIETLDDHEQKTDPHPQYLTVAEAGLLYQPLEPTLTALAALTVSADKMPYFNGSETAALATLTAFARTILDDADAATARATMGVTIGSQVQAYDATLAALAGITTEANKLIYATGADRFATTDLSAFGRTLIDDADAATARSTMGLGSAATLAADADVTLSANSDTRTATQKAIKTYVDGLIAANDAMVFKGLIDCSTNPNYPAADRGHTYRASVGGKIGGASGPNVEAGDILICQTDGTTAGTQATVGTNWGIIQTNIDGAITTSNIGSQSVAYAANSGQLNGQAASYYQPASTAITTSNIGSQSVNYASSAGNGGVTSVNGMTGAVTLSTGGVTSLNGQTGAIVDTNLYAIGSYICGRPQNFISYGVNSTVAGSSLYSCSTRGSYNYLASESRYYGDSDGRSLINIGSWRCVSPAYAVDEAWINDKVGFAGIWVRYA